MNVNLLPCRSRRLAAIIMILGILLCSCAYSYSFESGTGEPYDPYQISTAEQLMQIGSDLSLMKKSFVLTSDIDLDPNLPGGRIFRTAVIAHSVDDGRSNQRIKPRQLSRFQKAFDGHMTDRERSTRQAFFISCIGLTFFDADHRI